MLAAGNTSPKDSRSALTKLCSAYWYPLYAFVRRKGHTSHDAQELTQEFFFRLLQSKFLGNAKPDKGKFRSYLLGALKNFLATERDKAQALKRGGTHQIHVEIDSLEARYKEELLDIQSPDQLFEQRWAFTLLESTRDSLQREYAKREKADLFEELQPYLPGGRLPMTYADLAKKNGVSVSTIKMSVQRMRQRFGELLRHEIAKAVESDEEIDDEIRALIRATGQGSFSVM